MLIKTPAEIEQLRVAGRHLAQVLDAVERAVAPGVTLLELNAIAEREVRARGDTPAFLGYRPTSAPKPFPATLCVALNNIVVHGIPTKDDAVLKEGDILGIDTGLVHEGMIVDAGRTVAVGTIDRTAEQLIAVTRESLMAGIEAAQAGNTVGDIGHAIESYVRSASNFTIVELLCGHGVGHKVHEDPQIPNYGRAGSGPKLLPGMVLAIEPMLNEGTKDVVFERDGYTVRTRDGKRSAHFEHTIVVTEQGPEVLTKS